LDEIIFLNESLPLSSSQPICGYITGQESCCSELNMQDLAVFYEKMKFRIEDYAANFFVNFKNLLNPFLDLNKMGVSEVPTGLENDLTAQILRFRKTIQDLNKKLARCMGETFNIFAGFMCLSCEKDWEKFLFVNNPEIIDTLFSDYIIKIEEGNCKNLYRECEAWIIGRQGLNEEIKANLAKMIDILTAYVGGIPYEKINQLDPRFKNTTTSRVLFEDGNFIWIQ
jgi:hypothetical protein